MIPLKELTEAAVRNGVPLTTVERDYVQGRLLHSFPPSVLVLKGGTAIRKAYLREYRYSDDLDFTLMTPLDTTGLRQVLVDAVASAGVETGIGFLKDITLSENQNGWVGAIRFHMYRTRGSPVKIKIDVTRWENEPMMLKPRVRTLYHPYSDGRGAGIPVYSLEEIFAEKARALFQRTRPRDLYDVARLAGHIYRGALRELVLEKCRLKKVSMDLDDLERRRVDYEKAWDASLSHQITPLPDVRTVMSEVREMVRQYCSLHTA